MLKLKFMLLLMMTFIVIFPLRPKALVTALDTSSKDVKADAVARAVQNGTVSGYGCFGLFGTNDPVTSEQSVTTPQPAPMPQPTTMPTENRGEEREMIKISITVGSSVFSAEFYSNDTTEALLTQFPMTLKMSELNGNEKYYNLPERLPTSSERVGSIRTGDLMLYGSDCLVLFYESFSTSYSYTRLGRIEDASGLAGALGRGSVEVTFRAD